MKRFLILLAGFVALTSLRAQPVASLVQDFQRPPASARPWVYWFWNNANVTSNGITADLEAMQLVGVGGVLIMDVLERFAPPRGTAEFMNPEWQDLFQFSVQEAARLGLEINLANGPGWCGSSGPWITPELSMQRMVSTNFSVSGPTNFFATLAQPDIQVGKPKRDGLDSTVKFEGFYRDIAVLAFPAATNGIVARDAVVDLSAKLDAEGNFNWAVPPGDWIIQRIGHTTTGSSTRPPVAGGNGLECDKLSAAALDVHFTNLLGRLIARAGPLVGKSFTATHIDSWEVGSQNWTPELRGEFQKRRGYDPLPFLPCLLDTMREKAGDKTVTRYAHNIGGQQLADRFRWDFAQTISELLAENYSGRLAELAHQHGLRYSLEGYTLPFGDQFSYESRADEPMTEFWINYKFNPGYTDARAHEAASAAHVFGRTVVGAEAFTAREYEKWKYTPADIKALGDFEFTQGVNRFVIHRYAHQPYTNRVPGATMGPWGLHYERTQTWWEMSGAWHEYLARCQFMLRQGLFVADLLYLRPENPNQTSFRPDPAPPSGYCWDEISAEALLARVTVKNRRLVLPDGMNYRVLVLPPVKTMTPALAKKIKSLITDGATVVASGAPPMNAPGLADFPNCDEQLARLTREIWGDCDAHAVTEHALGDGKLTWGVTLEKILADMKAPPDFTSDVPLNWIHRRMAGADIYFVANASNNAVVARCAFRTRLNPEIWNPETGTQSRVESHVENGRTVLTLTLGAGDSVFMVFRRDVRPLPFLEAPTNLMAQISGPWRAAFDPKRGGPALEKLAKLASWTDSTNTGVKFYSGMAVYHTTFDLPKSKIKKQKVFLELGEVHVMARVKVNGRDCGIAWRPPFRVEVTGALHPGKNELEVSVANLWPNRLIGDAALPENARITWSSWQPFTNGTPLLKSGLLGPVRLLGGGASGREIIPAIPAGRVVGTNVMQKIYDEVKTPFKYGVVIKGTGQEEFVDCPSIFRSGGHWYMMYVAITNEVGYQTFLARSDDLLHWEKLGKVLSFGNTNAWDAWQADGGIALGDDRWNGSHELEKFDGKYWMSYIGGALQGYETDPLSIGVAWTKNPARIVEWNRVTNNPVLTPRQPDVRSFEALTLYKSQVIHDQGKSLGWPFVMFYNGKYKNGYEQIGMAVSRDMVNWSRYGTNSVIVNGEDKQNGISGDPQIVKLGGVWVMFYFGAGWEPHAFDTFACSYDLAHWTKWEGTHLVQPSEPFDETYAHKPWVVKWNGVVYHFYCAVGTEGRVIALATSRNLKTPAAE